MKNNKVWRTVISLFFLLGGGVLLAVYALGFGEDIALFSVLTTIFLGCISLTGFISCNFKLGTIPLAIIAEIWKDELGFPDYNFWLLLLAAFLIGLGLDIIFGKARRERRQRHRGYHHCGARYNDNIEDDFHGRYSTSETGENEESITAEVNFAGQDKYVRSQNLKNADLYCHFGSLKMFFEKCVPSDEGLEINLDVSFGSIELYVPRNWNIEDQVQVTAGAVEGATIASGDYISVKLTGRVSFGAVKIIYI